MNPSGSWLPLSLGIIVCLGFYRPCMVLMLFSIPQPDFSYHCWPLRGKRGGSEMLGTGPLVM
jgi:hypothetical protein